MSSHICDSGGDGDRKDPNITDPSPLHRLVAILADLLLSVHGVHLNGGLFAYTSLSPCGSFPYMCNGHNREQNGNTQDKTWYRESNKN